AQAMGLRTIAVFSEADAGSVHVQMADEAVLIGPAAARDSYLRMEAVLAAAKVTGAEAIHPGYGFLSENAEFAEKVRAAGLIWIGPDPESIRAMGLKDAAKALMQSAGVPVTPGYMGDDQSPERLQSEADAICYPVLIKAVAGGGGKGMKKVETSAAFAESLASAQREAQAAFGDPRVLIEKYITRPRHIEVQIFGDAHGQIVHLYERDCSLQRRHQKVIEEAPAPGMDDATRSAVTDAAIRAARAVNYKGAGTVEFIADASEGLRADRIWFMEMNTRLQVEHPVTESVTGVDLVEWQLRVAAGEPLPLRQDDIALNGHAMEARLYAEDPAKGFLPSIGTLDHFVLPDTIRVDTGVEAGGEVSQFYDPMIAKLIVHAEDRETAAGELAEACRQVEVWPVRTNAAFLARCLDHETFLEGEVDTAFIATFCDDLIGEASPPVWVAAAALGQRAYSALLNSFEGEGSPWQAGWSGLMGMRLNGPARAPLSIACDGLVLKASISRSDESDGSLSPIAVTLGEDRFDVALTGTDEVSVDDTPLTVLSVEDGLVVFEDGEAWLFQDPDPAHGADTSAASDGALRAPMPGKIVAVQAQNGQVVSKGDPLLVLEAMKMEHQMAAPFDGIVGDLTVSVGDQVTDGTVLARVLKAAEAAA
ncbi:MAG: biotin carboxylase N-terminal domain-containing protein, partial [Asticcacaulis sp.]